MFCDRCVLEDRCDKVFICNGLKALQKVCAEQDTEERRELIREYARELNIINYEVSEELRQLGEKVIAGMPELYYITEFEIKVGYVLSYEAKKKDGKSIAADCRKVTGPYQAFLPFDFVVTFYEPSMSYMTENQRKVLMLHELKHIGIGERGLRIEHHNIEDFESILSRYGLNWNAFNNDVPDILVGGGSEEEGRNKGKKK
ncbi:putative metallopeptidase [Sporomusa paucivorans]|uniref:putative metallopeptidase n=1 Tax=Sporomusa paucivorans TaxID=2376 RepID=UPI0035716582